MLANINRIKGIKLNNAQRQAPAASLGSALSCVWIKDETGVLNCHWLNERKRNEISALTRNELASYANRMVA